jgi:hypothetical protein
MKRSFSELLARVPSPVVSQSTARMSPFLSGVLDRKYSAWSVMLPGHRKW